MVVTTYLGSWIIDPCLDQKTYLIRTRWWAMEKKWDLDLSASENNNFNVYSAMSKSSQTTGIMVVDAWITFSAFLFPSTVLRKAVKRSLANHLSVCLSEAKLRRSRVRWLCWICDFFLSFRWMSFPPVRSVRLSTDTEDACTMADAHCGQSDFQGDRPDYTNINVGGTLNTQQTWKAKAHQRCQLRTLREQSHWKVFSFNYCFDCWKETCKIL